MAKSNWAFAAGNLKPDDAAVPGKVHEFKDGFAAKFLGLAEDDTSHLKELRFARMGVIGEGSCAFHSLCVALNHEDYVHKSEKEKKAIAYAFRCKFGNKLTNDKLKAIAKRSKGKSPLSLEEARQALCDPKVWADEVIIRWVSECLNMNLIFLDLDKRSMYCGVHHDEALGKKNIPPTIIILWVNHQHFEPLCRIVNTNKNSTTLQALFDPKEDDVDADIVYQIMKHYKQQCKIKD